MSRKKRIWYPGATYHVMSRGNRRSYISVKKLREEMFRSSGGVAGGWSGSHFFESKVHISEMRI